MHKKQVVKYAFISIIPIVLLALLVIFYPRMNDPDFYIQDLRQEFTNKISSLPGGSNCSRALSRMKLINVRFYSENQKVERHGQFIVFDAIALEVLNLFRDLFNKKFEIKKINSIIHYDTYMESLMDNNSTAFFCVDPNIEDNYLHALGMAFDINPIQNPVILTNLKNNQHSLTLHLLESLPFINRSNIRPGMVEPVIGTFAKHGFVEWGGNRLENINWHYFALNSMVAKMLMIMTAEDGREFFKITIRNQKAVSKFTSTDCIIELERLYLRNPKKFISNLKKNFSQLAHVEQSEFLASMQ